MVAFGIGVLAACDNVLQVDLPGQVTSKALYDPGQATILVNSAASLFECGFSDFVASDAAGFEDVMTRDTGWWGGRHEYDTDPPTGKCNTADTGVGWWTPLQAARFMGEKTYDLMTNEWTTDEIQGDPNQLEAELAIYLGADYELFGEYFCDMAFEGGKLMGPDEVLASADDWLTKAIGHINDAGGDFAISGGVSSSAMELAYLLRGRVRYARGDESGAAADFAQVEKGFVAYDTRDAGGERTRWNKVYSSHNQEQINTVIPAVTWWEGPPNPWTGEAWPDTIPFTGYLNLGILPNGRAVADDGVAITTDAEPTAVADTRVPVVDLGRKFNEHESWRQEKYPGLDADIPMANWEDVWLLRAKMEGGATAVDLVNEIRDFHGLPEVSYVDPSDADQVRNMIIEEQRRSLFLEGRFWATKIREHLWFPRGVGHVEPPTTFGYRGGVRMVMPENEYRLNDNFGLADRGTMCAPNEAPVL